jgi:hypothetical protein
MKREDWIALAAAIGVPVIVIVVLLLTAKVMKWVVK